MALRVSSPVLVGRGAELATLLNALDDVASGRATTVLVDGEAGIGKTRLVRELEADARASGAIVLHGGCVRLGRDDGLPFAPVAEILRGLIRDRGTADLRGMLDVATAELSSLVPELGPATRSPLLDQRPDWARTRLFEAVLVLLSRLGAEGPAVMVVEDLHWADRSTRDLLAFLARILHDERVLLVGTYRSDELHRRHPLRPWATEMDRLGVVRISLGRLDHDALREQIQGITGRPPSSELVRGIETRSDGNPFFVEELLAAPDADHLPETLRELLLARVAALSEETQRILGVASVAGPIVDHDVLIAVAGTTDEAASGPIRQAIGAHLISPSSVGDRNVYTFRHALLQEAIYDDLLPRDRRRLHAEYARVLESLPEMTGAALASQLAALAHHAEAAHDLAKALASWLRGARAAYAVHASAEASHAYLRALDLWDAVPEADRPVGIDLVDVLYDASFALNGSGDLGKARDVATRAYELEGGRDVERSALLLERLGRTEWLNGDLVAANETLRRATELIEGLPPSRVSARVVSSLAGLLMLRGASALAISHGERALELARAVGARDVEAHALNTLGASVSNLGDCERGIRLGREGIAMAIELDRWDEIHRGYACLTTTLEQCGLVEESAAVSLEGVDWASRHGMWRLQGAFLQGNAASAFYLLGRWAEAERLVASVEDLRVEGVAMLNQAITAGPLAIHTGRLDDARRILDRARARIARLRDAQFTGPISVALAELAIAEGRPDGVHALVEESLGLMAETDDLRHRSALMALAVRADAAAAAVAAARRDDAGAAAHRERAERWLNRLREFVDASDTTDARAIREARASLAVAEAEHAAMAGLASAPAWARAAEAWASLDRPFPEAQCRLREAESLLTAGDRGRAGEVLALAHVAAVRIGATVLRGSAERMAALGRIHLPDAPRSADEGGEPAGSAGTIDTSPNAFELTDRELQILPLLVAGYTNRQIGEAMFISPSTAGVHVSRILGKMGVTSRVEAAALAVRAGLAD